MLKLKSLKSTKVNFRTKSNENSHKKPLINGILFPNFNYSINNLEQGVLNIEENIVKIGSFVSTSRNKGTTETALELSKEIRASQEHFFQTLNQINSIKG